jgi:AcrR family transcriptional regulator
MFPRAALITSTLPTVDRLLLAAQSLFLERNYADATMDQICAMAEVTKGALYHHFASKEELYLAMLLADLGEKKELFQRSVQHPGSCQARLRLLTEDYFRLPKEKRDLITLVRRDINVFPEKIRTHLVSAYQDALPKQVEAILRDGIASGELAEANERLLSWEFVALVEVLLSPYAEQVFPTVDAKLDHILKVFIGGAQTPPTSS